MSENPEGREIVHGRKVTFGRDQFDLIMLYNCPLCKEPIIAYWKLNGRKPITSDVVGRALRDSGFGGYSFFETVGGQGFEYAHQKDPRKRHGHEKKEESGYGEDKILELWMPFLSLNPVFSINDFFSRCLNPHDDSYEKGHEFVTDQDLATDLIKEMRKFGDTFIVVEDVMEHGKPLFYFNLVLWDELTKVSYWQATQDASHKKRLEALRKWFGPLFDRVKYIRPEDEGTKEEEPE